MVQDFKSNLLCSANNSCILQFKLGVASKTKVKYRCGRIRKKGLSGWMDGLMMG